MTNAIASTLMGLVLGAGLPSVAMAEPTTTQAGKHLFILSGQSNMRQPLPESFETVVSKVFGKDNVTVAMFSAPSQSICQWYKKWAPPEGVNVHDVGNFSPLMIMTIEGALASREKTTPPCRACYSSATRSPAVIRAKSCSISTARQRSSRTPATPRTLGTDWNRLTGGYATVYYSNAESFLEIGEATGRAVLELAKDKK